MIPTKTRSSARNAAGWNRAAHSPPITSASSMVEAATLLNGSGEVLIRARLAAFVK